MMFQSERPKENLRRLRPWLILALVPLLVAAPLALRPAATIVRDEYGVPHIYAGTAADLFRAWGYAAAQDRLWQMEVARASVWGRVAELLGPGEADRYVNLDIGVRRDGYTAQQIAQEIDALPVEYRALLEAFATGINHFIDRAAADPAVLPYEYHALGLAPQPWSGADVAQLWIGTMASRFSDRTAELERAAVYDQLVSRHGPEQAALLFDDIFPLAVPDSPTTCPPVTPVSTRPLPPHPPAHRLPPGISIVARREVAAETRDAATLAGLGLATTLGSHMWMAATQESGVPHSLIAGGPQMGFFVPGYLSEVGLHGAGFDAVGTALAGVPVILFGHNADIAWSSTSGLGNQVDVFSLELVGDQTHYLHDGEVVAMERRTETILVHGQASHTVDLYRSLYGPVIAWGDGVAYATQRAWDGQALASWAAWLASTRATTFAEFSAAAADVALSVNWGYASRSGDVAFLHLGRYPVRHPAVDTRLPVTGTGEYDWSGFQPVSWNPQCVTSDGVFANWNNRPAHTYPIGDFAAGNWNSYHKVQALLAALTARPQVTLADLQAANRAIGFLDPEAAYFIPLLAEWAGTGLEPRMQEALDRLAAWAGADADDDFDAYYDDPARTIWDVWWPLLANDVLADELGVLRQYRPEGTIPGLLLHVFQGAASAVPLSRDYMNGVPRAALLQNALRRTLLNLESRYGSPDMDTWLTPVDPHRFQTTSYQGVPVAAVPVDDLHLRMARGTQNHLVVLAAGGIEAVNVNPPGQSGWVDAAGVPGAHYADQLALFEDYYGYKVMWFDEEDVLAHAESIEVLGPYRLWVPLVRRGVASRG